MNNEYGIIISPVITEKNNELAAAGKYVFRVNPKAGKIEIGKAVEKLFSGVKVKSVNIMNCAGKPKRVGRTPRVGRRPDWKKAVVTLAEGSIDFI